MSTETSTWLNNFTLIGFTEKRGKAWHYRKDSQGDTPNHYPEAIPQDDVIRRLFDWEPLEGTSEGTFLLPDGVLKLVDDTAKSIARPPGALSPDDPGKIFKHFKKSYSAHGYKEWLVETLSQILDSELAIGSAGLLKEGAVGWVQVESPDSIKTSSGVEFRPFLTACTSLDGSLATTYMTGNQLVVCDNTLTAATGNAAAKYKVRHTSGSQARLQDARNALEILFDTGETFAAEVEKLTNITVSDREWTRFLNELLPLSEAIPGNTASIRSRTRKKNVRNALTAMYTNDNRANQWHGTAFGVLQAVNTFEHHNKGNDDTRIERNMMRAVSGKADDLDRSTLDLLAKVLA